MTLMRNSLLSKPLYCVMIRLKACSLPNKFYRERHEHKVFLALLKSIPGLEKRLMNAASEDEIHGIATLVSFNTKTVE